MVINNNNPAGVLWIGFKGDADQETIQARISQIYKNNEDIIQGMTFDMLTDVKSMLEGKKIAEHEWRKPVSQENNEKNELNLDYEAKLYFKQYFIENGTDKYDTIKDFVEWLKLQSKDRSRVDYGE